MGYECKQSPNYKMEAPHKSYPQRGDEIPVRLYEMEGPYKVRESHYREGPLGKRALKEWPLGYLVHDTFFWFIDASKFWPSTPSISWNAQGEL